MRDDETHVRRKPAVQGDVQSRFKEVMMSLQSLSSEIEEMTDVLEGLKEAVEKMRHQKENRNA